MPANANVRLFDSRASSTGPEARNSFSQSRTPSTPSSFRTESTNREAAQHEPHVRSRRRRLISAHCGSLYVLPTGGGPMMVMVVESSADGLSLHRYALHRQRRVVQCRSVPRVRFPLCVGIHRRCTVNQSLCRWCSMVRPPSRSQELSSPLTDAPLQGNLHHRLVHSWRWRQGAAYPY